MAAAGIDAKLSAVAIIPARYGSTRLPGKPLLEAGGLPLIEHVYRAVCGARRLARVLVATDDPRILATVQNFGGEARLTGEHHRTGSDRIGELLEECSGDVILNVQGDEPEIDPNLLDTLVEELENEPELQVATAACPFPTGSSPDDPAAVKVVTDRNGRALYFSRAPIPFGGTHPGGTDWPLLHVGVYAYRRAALERFLTLPEGRLERVEGLEQLRLLENGMPVGVVKTAAAPAGIDTPDDFERFRRRVEGRETPGPAARRVP